MVFLTTFTHGTITLYCYCSMTSIERHEMYTTHLKILIFCWKTIVSKKLVFRMDWPYFFNGRLTAPWYCNAILSTCMWRKWELNIPSKAEAKLQLFGEFSEEQKNISYFALSSRIYGNCLQWKSQVINAIQRKWRKYPQN